MRHSTRFARSLVALTVLWIAVGVTLAQPAGTPAPDADRTMQRIEHHLAEIATSLRELRAEQRVMRTVRRLELAERRLAPLRNEIRDAKSDVRSRTEELDHTEAVELELREQLQQAISDGADPQSVPVRGDLEHFERNAELMRVALEDAERRVIEAEDELARARKSADALEGALDELLEDLDD